MVVLSELDKKTLLRAGEAVTVHELKSILCKSKVRRGTLRAVRVNESEHVCQSTSGRLLHRDGGKVGAIIDTRPLPG